eukprot:6207384-Pleurochrysis_carterae.AAC.4
MADAAPLSAAAAAPIAAAAMVEPPTCSCMSSVSRAGLARGRGAGLPRHFHDTDLHAFSFNNCT